MKESANEGKNLCSYPGIRLFSTNAEVTQLWVTINPIQVDQLQYIPSVCRDPFIWGKKKKICHCKTSILFQTFTAVLLQGCLRQAESDKITSAKLQNAVRNSINEGVQEV